MIYNKLVRDKIPEHISKNGGKSLTHIATDQEYWQKLKEKLSEEVNEFQAAENMEEYADILEVLEAIAYYKKFDKQAVEQLKDNKATEKGKFKNKIILDEA